MSLNCAFCGELIEGKPVRKGSLFFCSPECYEDFMERESDNHDAEEEWERERT